MATTIGIGGDYARRSVRDQLTGGKADHSGRVFQLLLLLSLGVSLGVLAILFYDVFVEGVSVFSSRAESFLSGGLRSSAAASGVFQAIKGTFWIGVFVVVLSFPIGVALTFLVLLGWFWPAKDPRTPPAGTQIPEAAPPLGSSPPAEETP